jgi:hypothetical protein
MPSTYWEAFGVERLHLRDVTGSAIFAFPGIPAGASLGSTALIGKRADCEHPKNHAHCVVVSAYARVGPVVTDNYFMASVGGDGALTLQKIYNAAVGGIQLPNLLGQSGLTRLEYLCDEDGRKRMLKGGQPTAQDRFLQAMGSSNPTSSSGDKNTPTLEDECNPKISYAACVTGKTMIQGTHIEIPCGFALTARVQLNIPALDFKWFAEIDVKINTQQNKVSIKGMMMPIKTSLISIVRPTLLVDASFGGGRGIAKCTDCPYLLVDVNKTSTMMQMAARVKMHCLGVDTSVAMLLTDQGFTFHGSTAFLSIFTVDLDVGSNGWDLSRPDITMDLTINSKAFNDKVAKPISKLITKGTEVCNMCACVWMCGSCALCVWTVLGEGGVGLPIAPSVAIALISRCVQCVPP